MKIVVVEVPVGEVDGGYVARFVGARLSPRQAHGLKGLVCALRERNVELANGRPVMDGASAVRWMLEQISVDS